jgi:excinuclease ABC subunit C
VLPRTSPALKLVQRVRNEAHRFAIAYHRRLRSDQLVRSALDDIPGIGQKTRLALLRHFGTIAAIASASADQLAAVPGIGRVTAERVLSVLSHPALHGGATNAVETEAAETGRADAAAAAEPGADAPEADDLEAEEIELDAMPPAAEAGERQPAWETPDA